MDSPGKVRLDVKVGSSFAVSSELLKSEINNLDMWK